jgi:hypothetical protein
MKYIYGYIVIAILTMGYAANAEYAEGEMVNSFGVNRVVDGGVRISVGYAAGLAWPLYVSYKMFYFARQNGASK